VELLFGFFFLFVVVDAAMSGSWATAILLLPFPVGFFYTSLCSLSRMLPSTAADPSPKLANRNHP
jgi:hypothetical protein